MRRYILSFFVAFAVCGTVHSQEDPNIATGLKAFGLYHQGNIDRINVSNGALSVDIPIISYPQRGGRLRLDLALHYENRGNYGDEVCVDDDPSTCTGYGPFEFVHGFNIVQQGVPVLLASASSGEPNGFETETALVMTPDGGTHELAPINNSTWRSLNGSGYQAVFDYSTPGQMFVDTPLLSSAALYDPQGTLYRFPADTNTTDPYVIPGPSRPYLYQTDTDLWISSLQQDRNGNQVTFSPTAGWTDTVGRPIPVPTQTTDFGKCTDPRIARAWTWNLPGVNGSNYPITLCEIQISETIQFWSEGGLTPMTYNAYELQSVILPDQTQWVFDYTSDGLGDLQTITFPTGGTISYTWSNPGELLQTHAYQFTRGVSKRIFNPNDGSAPAESDYSYTRNVSGQNTLAWDGTTTISDGTSNNGMLGSDANDVVHTFLYSDSWDESEGDTYQGTGASRALMMSVQNGYQNFTLPDGYLLTTSVLTSATTTWPGAASTQSQMQYGYNDPLTYYQPVYQCGDNGCVLTSGGNPQTISYMLKTSESDSDYGSGTPGPVLRTTATAYRAFDGSANSSDYLNANLLNLVSSVTVSGAGGSQMTLGYDETGSPQGVFGNLTSINQWSNSSNAFLATGFTYSAASFGMPLTKKDPNSYVYHMAYDPTGLFVTSTTNPLGQVVSQTFDFNTGQMTSRTDANNQQTTYQYNDSLERLTDIIYPDVYPGTSVHGHVMFQYTDSPAGSSVKISKLMTPSQQATTEVDFDGFGRQIETKVSESASSTIYTRRQYDYRGRVGKVWNASRCDPMTVSSCSAESTFGFTTNTYDPLDRVTAVTEPDNSATTKIFTANVLDVYDESGRHWRRTYDGLERLAKVLEPDGSNNPTIETDYTYDVLGNLISVNQLGVSGETPRARSFSYDSLSRLITATNPETGTVCYGTWNGNYCNNGYDANGNLTARTDSRGVVLSMQYDPLNRLTSKTFPGSTYQYFYDGSDGAQHTYAIGRLTHPSNDVNAASELSYDPMGRVTAMAFCIPSDCSYTKSFAAQYDLAGNVSQLTYPDGLVVNITRDNVERAQSVDSTLPSTYNYATFNSYAPTGAATAVALGNGVNGTSQYNNRLQLTNREYSSSAGQLMNTSFVWTDVNGHNNGNIWGQIPNLNTPRTLAFNYDNLNRIISATEQDNAFGQTFSYDSFGNLKQNGSYTFLQAYDSHNRILGWSYDAAGNLLGDQSTGCTLVYDGEGKITNVSVCTGASYVYDANGQRVRSNVGSSWTEDVYFGGELMAQKNQAGVWTDYIRVDGMLIARSSPSGAFYYHTDHLGSTRQIIDQNASNEINWYYSPFGSNIYSSGTSEDLTFTGKQTDYESGLQYLGARYYSSNMGRFMTPDWSAPPEAVPYADLMNPQSLNLYSYLENNPFSRVDPDGHCSSPSVGKGQVGVCVDLYIQTKTINLLGMGDGRGPAANDPNATYRVQLQMVADPSKGTVNLVQDDAGVSKALGGLIQNKGTSTTSPLNPTTDDNGTTHFTLNNTALNGLHDWPGAPQDTIKTSINMDITQGGKVGIEGGMRTAYPSLEIYSYDSSGKATTILRMQEHNPSDLRQQNQPIPQVAPQ